jgi:hypothetical protein
MRTRRNDLSAILRAIRGSMYLVVCKERQSPFRKKLIDSIRDGTHRVLVTLYDLQTFTNAGACSSVTKRIIAAEDPASFEENSERVMPV